MTFNGTLSGGQPVVVEVLRGVNELTGNVLGLFLVILVWGIVYFGNSADSPKEALTGATWAALLVAIPLALLGLLLDRYVGYIIVLAIGTAALMMMRTRY